MRLALTLCLSLVPALTFAQGFPTPVSGAPFFGYPAPQGGSSNPFTNVSFTGQALGPFNCTTAPAYSFTSAPTNGFGGSATTICGVIGGTAIWTGSSASQLYAVKVGVPSGTAAAPSLFGTGATTTGLSITATPSWILGVNGAAVLTGTASLVASAQPMAIGAVPATTGAVRLEQSGNGYYRNSANSANLAIWRTGEAVANDLFLGNTTGPLTLQSNVPVSITVGFAVVSLAVSGTAPSGPVACTSPSVLASNGTAAFTIDVGGTCAAVTTLVVTLPAVTTAWVCDGMNVTSSATARVEMTASNATSATFTNYTRTTGVALAWVDGTDVRIACTGQ